MPMIIFIVILCRNCFLLLEMRGKLKPLLFFASNHTCRPGFYAERHDKHYSYCSPSYHTHAQSLNRGVRTDHSIFKQKVF